MNHNWFIFLYEPVMVELVKFPTVWNSGTGVLMLFSLFIRKIFFSGCTGAPKLSTDYFQPQTVFKIPEFKRYSPCLSQTVGNNVTKLFM